MVQEYPEALPKPRAVLDLYHLAEEAFDALRRGFPQLGPMYVIPIENVDQPGPEVLRNETDLAAMTLRKLQALRYVATDGVITGNDVVVSLITDLVASVPRLARCMEDEAMREILMSKLEPMRRGGETAAKVSGGGLAVLQ